MRTEEIKRSIDLADYVRSFGIELKPHGKNNLKGLCPFHDDHNPSLIITPSKQLFNCPVCNKGGDLFKFAEYYHNVDFKAAKEILEESLPNFSAPRPPCRAIANGDGGSPLVPRSALSPERANQLLEKVISFYEKTFADVPEGREYLESRGITDAGLYSTHRIGYCNGTLTNILPSSRGESKKVDIHDELKELGILFDNNHERFTGCVIVPVFDSEGNVVTPYGRDVSESDRKPLDKAQGRKHMFLPGRSKGLWNVSSIKTYPNIILVESIVDGLSAQMAGHHNIIALNGNNSFNNGEIDLLREHGVQSVTFLLDGDEAGQKAMTQLVGKLNGHFTLNPVTLSGNHDPNSYLIEHGAEKLNDLLTDTCQSAGPPTTAPSSCG